MVRRFSFGLAAFCLALLSLAVPVQAQSTGSISGTVTNAAGGAGIQGVSVFACGPIATSADTCFNLGASTASNGTYTISNVPAGSYRIYTYSGYTGGPGFIDQFYTSSGPTIECGGCRPSLQTSATTVTVGTSAVPGINFLLRAGAKVTGTITDLATGAPLQNVNINLYRTSGAWFAASFVSTDASGNFTSGALPPGLNFAAVTQNSLGYVDRIYNNVTCIGGTCSTSSGNPITFASDTSPNLTANFTLEKGAKISGKLMNRAGGAALTSGSITIFNSTGVSVGFANPTSSGTTAGEYTSPGLPAGTYYVKAQTFGTPSFIGQLFDDIACTSCSATSGTPIVLAAGDARTAVDFKMDAAGTITGTLRDATTNAPIANASVQAYLPSGGSSVAFGGSDSAGVYTLAGLATGSYIVRAFGPFGGSPSYISRVYTTTGGFDCPNCDVTGGSPVSVTAGSSTPGIDLFLTQGGAITGTVKSAVSPFAAIANLNVTVLNSSGQFVSSGNTNSSGVYTASGLLAGTYYVRTNSSSTSNFIPEIWTDTPTNHVTCVSCSVSAGTAIVLGAAQTKTADFNLLAGASISGRVTNAAGTTGIQGFSTIQVNNSLNQFVTNSGTNASGDYTVVGLPAGTYFLKTNAGGGYIDEVFDDIQCLGCSATGGTPISLGDSEAKTGVDFKLVLGGRIAGKVTDQMGAPLGSSQSGFVSVTITNGSGQFVASAGTAPDGTYITSTGLPAGTYFAATGNGLGYINTLYNGIACFNCPSTSGTPISVTVGATTNNVNFVLTTGAAISGVLTNASGGAAIANANVSVYSNTGSFLGSGFTNAQGKYTVGGLPSDSYFVRTQNGVGFVDQLFGGGVCLGCDVKTGAPVATSIALAATSTCPAATMCGIDFSLSAGATLSGRVTDASSAAGLANVSVQVYNSGGSFVTSANTQSDGTYAVKGLPPGAYFARTFNSLGYINLLKGTPSDIVCGNCFPITVGQQLDVPAGGLTNVNFALSLGSILKGRVTTTGATPVGIPNVSVSVLTSTGSFVASWSTDGAGNYTISGIVPGTYFLKTFNSQGFIDQVFKGIECLGCSVSAGTPVTLGVGTTALEDFKLPAGGRIRGKVTDASGNPLAGVTVNVSRPSGSFVTLGTTTAQGTYVTNIGLPPGDYVVKTSNQLGYVDKLYDNITCLNCSVTTGKLVTLTGVASTVLDSDGEILSGAVSDVANVDFSLALGGGISGNVKAAAGGAPLQGVFVQIYTDAGSFVSSTSTNGLGNYVLKGVPTGTYFARTSNSAGYIDKLWDAIDCTGCPAASGKPIAVTVGNVTPGIDFTLTTGGRVSGTVTSSASGLPIGSVSVQVYNLAGVFVASGFTSTAGTYITGGLPAGEYYVKTFNSLGFINQLHSGIICQSCSVTGGTKISVSLGAPTTVNFSLATGGSISGKVTSKAGANLANLNVQVYTSTGSFFSSFNTAADGTYTIGGLPTGNYTVRTSNSSGFIDKLYDDLTCISCNASSGKPVAVTVGSNTGGIDFALDPGGLVSGNVTDAATGKPLANISVQLYNAANFFVSSATTDTLGNYTMRAGVPAGTYFARTFNSVGFINVIYPSNTCLNCPVTVGSPIAVNLGQTTTGIDFALALGGRITGTITDATTGLALGGVSVSLSLADGTFVGSGGTNSLGFYSTQGLPAGTYYARTNNGLGYINRLYNGIDCVRCATGVGTPITVTVGAPTANIDFALRPGARIAGKITDAVTGLPLGGISVTIADASGFGVTGATTNAAGEYLTFAGLTPGTYYARTQNQAGYVNKLYDTYLCLQCNMTTGKPIAVTTGTTSGIDFALSPGGRISGTITAGGNGLANAFVDIFSSGGTYLTGVNTGSAGQFITGEGLPPGQYYLVTENQAGLIDQLYNGNNLDATRPILECGFTCAVTSGKAVDVAAGATTASINFALNPGGRIAGRVTSSATGVGLANIRISIHNTTGAWVAYAFTDGLGNYTTAGGVPTGTYFVRTNSSNKQLQFINEVYNNTACPGCDPTKGTPVSVTSPSTTTGIDFALDSGEVITGMVKDSVTNQPISGASVRIVDGSGNFVAGGGTDDSGAFVITSALPAGTYFARTFNGRGYVDRVYDTDVCLACDVTRGTPIVVDGVGSTDGINFTLTPGGRITGTVTATTGGGSVAGSKIRFFNSAGSFIGQVFTNGAGVYTSFGLPPGNYFVRTANTSGLIDELYNDAKCVPCNMSQGAAVNVLTAGLKGGIDFVLDAGGLVSGYIKDQATGSPIPNVTVSIYRASDGVLVAITDPTDSNGYYQISLPVGTYQVEPNPVAGFRPALAALRGPFARTTVVVSTDTETTGVGFSLVACAPLTVNPSTLPLAAQGQLYSSTLTATGGTGPYTFTVTDGNPNTGLALAASGLLAGTPVFSGTGNFTIGATDANQCAGTRTFALTACSFFLSSNSLSTTAAAGTGSVTLTASATDCPWTVSTAASWITITSAVTGTGNATVTFSYVFNATGASRGGVITIGGQTFTVTQAASSSGPAFGAVDTPADGVTGISGSLAVTGWALDDVEVKRIKVSRNPVAGEGSQEIYLGDATLVDGARPDVAAANVGLPFNTRAGFGYLLLTNMLPNQGNGTFTLHMDAVDAEGATTRLGSRTFVADNANATTPFGAIDTPPQGGTVSGNLVNFGWVLSPGTRRADPPGGGTVQVVLDGAFQATAPGQWTNRSDLSSLFPSANFAGVESALGVAVFDSTTLANGVHTIAWIVTDNGGLATGVGSRYFTVNNVLSSQRFAPTLTSMRANAVSSPASGPAVSARLGFDRTAPALALQADPLGDRTVAVGQLSRVELRFGQACGAVSAVQVANGERAALPVGTSLDPSGVFAWTPGPAFLGTYTLEFAVPSCGGGTTTIPVSIAVVAGR